MAELSLNDFFAHDHRYDGRRYTRYTWIVAIRYYRESRSSDKYELLRSYARRWQPVLPHERFLKKWILGGAESTTRNLTWDRRRRQRSKLTPGQITPTVRWFCKRLDEWLRNPYPAPCYSNEMMERRYG